MLLVFGLSVLAHLTQSMIFRSNIIRQGTILALYGYTRSKGIGKKENLRYGTNQNSRFWMIQDCREPGKKITLSKVPRGSKLSMAFKIRIELESNFYTCTT